MKKVKLCLILSITILFGIISKAQNSNKIILKDFSKLTGSWEGSLTYLDYSSGKPYTMKANVEIKLISNTNKIIFQNVYPNEMSANSIDTISISKDGRYIDKELIKSKIKLSNGDIEIITEEIGNDGNDNKTAIFRHTYTFGFTKYKKTKEVKFNGETAWIKRHEYSYKKKSKS